MKRMIARGLVACTVALGLPGCADLSLTGRPTTSPPGASDLVSNNAASFVGRVSVPTTLVSNNSASLVSNNSASLVSNNSASYRVAALSEEPLRQSLVYLLNPDERFYEDPQGARLVATTDEQGEYRLPASLPKGKQVIVSALLSGNRRLVGYTLTKAGENRVDVSVATTYVTEFFRAQAAARGRTMGDYANALDRFPELVQQTQALLDQGALGLPDLTIGQADAMNRAYLAAFGSRSQRLSDLWAELLGQRVLSLSTVAGNYALGAIQEDGKATALGLNGPTAVAVDKDGNVFVADQLNHVVRWVKPDGSSKVLGTFKGDGTVHIPELNANDVPFSELMLTEPQDLTCDPDGNVIVGLRGQVSRYETLIFLCRKAGTYFGRSMVEGRAYDLGRGASGTGDTHYWHEDGPLGTAHFNAITGVTSDDQGNLYVADRINNLIRRVDRTSGEVVTVAGLRDFDAEYGDTIITEERLASASIPVQPAVGALLFRPFDVAWCRGADGKERLYVWEGSNDSGAEVLGNAIRVVTIENGQYTGGTIGFVMGGPTKRGPATDGALADATLKLFDPADPTLPNGGIAVTPDGRYLYVDDAGNRVVRRIDLQAGTVRTVAGGGSEDGDAEPLKARLKSVSGLAIGPDGSVYFADSVNHVVRKLNRQFGE